MKYIQLRRQMNNPMGHMKELQQTKRTLLARLMILVLLTCSVLYLVPAESRAEAITTRITAFNLALENEIDIVCYVTTSNAPEGATEGVLFFDGPQSEYTLANACENVTVSPGSDAAGRKLYYFDQASAKQICDEFYARPYVLSDGNMTYGNVEKYSILEYCLKMKDSQTTWTDSTGYTLGDLIEKIIAYGDSAQQFFGYRTDNLASSRHVIVRTENASLSYSPSAGVTMNDGLQKGVCKIGSSVNLQAAFDGNVSWTTNYTASSLNGAMNEGREISVTLTDDSVSGTSVTLIPYTSGLVFSPDSTGSGAFATVSSFSFDSAQTGTVVIPSFFEGYPVTGIEIHAFQNQSKLTEIKLPASLTSINGMAFFKCTSLSAITLPEGLTTIGSTAFAYCSSLSSITYRGTMAQWADVQKGDSWCYDTKATVVHCSDGDVTIS